MKTTNKNDMLEEMFSLSEEIKMLEKRLQELKEYCKAKGSFMTAEYACTVAAQQRVSLAPLEDVKKYISEEELNSHNLIRKHQFVTVRVTRRELESEI